MTTVAERRGDVAPARRSRLPSRALAVPLAAWLASRALLLLAIGVGNWLRGGEQTVIDALHLWDGNWYLSAAAGYEQPLAAPGGRLGQTNIAFFPAYPLLIRGAVAITGMSPLAAAVGVNLLAGAVAVAGVWLLVRRVSGDEAADRSATLLCFFPGSVVLTMVYSEPVMLAFAAACLLALLARRWAAGGVLAALAGAARPNGIVLAACCAWAAVTATRNRDGGGSNRAGRDWRPLLAPAIAPLGPLGYLGWLWARTGDPTIWLQVQRQGWGERIDFGRRTVAEVGIVAGDLPSAQPTMLLQVLGLAFVAVAAVALWRWRPPAVLVVYTVGILASTLLSFTLGARPRFVLTAFPLVAAVAWAVRGRGFAVLLAGAAGLSALLAIVYTVPGLAVP